MNDFISYDDFHTSRSQLGGLLLGAPVQLGAQSGGLQLGAQSGGHGLQLGTGAQSGGHGLQLGTGVIGNFAPPP